MGFTRSDRAEIVFRALAAVARSESLSFQEKIRNMNDELQRATEDVNRRRNETDTIKPPALDK
jgi:hypothetical protein